MSNDAMLVWALTGDINSDLVQVTRDVAEKNGWQIVTEVKHIDGPANDKMRRPTETK